MSVLKSIQRRLSERQEYRSLFGWGLMLYSRALRRWPHLPLPFRGRRCRVAIGRSTLPVWLRLGTSDWLVMEEIYFREEYRATLDIARQVRVILDLGANIGLSVRRWQEAYPDSHVIAVEPDDDNLAMCRLNVLPHRAVTFVKALVAGAGGVAYLNRDGEPWAYHKEETPAGSAIRAITVPDLLLTLHPESRVDLFKCDIEGAEAEVFAGCRAWIGRVNTLVVEVHGAYRVHDLLNDVGPSFRDKYVRDEGSRGVVVLCRRGDA